MAAQAKGHSSRHLQEESTKYAQEAFQTVTLHGQEFRPFAPFRPALSAYQTLTRQQAVFLCLLLLGCGLGLILYGLKMLMLLLALITLLYLSSLLLNFWLAIRALGQSTEEQIDDAIVHALAGAEWPPYTILCPLYRETEVVPQFVQAMQALD